MPNNTTIPVSPNEPNIHLILPIGTQVVTRIAAKRLQGDICAAGAVGVITEAPLDETHSYTVKLPDGSLLRLRRSQLRIHRQSLGEEIRNAADPTMDSSLARCVIYKCIVGSRAYGLETESSDIDRRGIYLPPASRHWSIFGVPEQLENEETQECYWELQKFLRMALKANPNVLECLYTPLTETVHPIAEQLLSLRSMFVTKKIYQTYNGYVLSQFKRLEQDIRTTGSLKWKHAMHLMRLLLCGITALKEGYIPVQVPEHREILLTMKAGEISWEEVNAWRLELHRQFDQAYEHSRLPELPDFAKANEFLLRARQCAATQDWELYAGD